MLTVARGLARIMKTPATPQESASLSPLSLLKRPSPWAQGLLFCPSSLPAEFHRPGGGVQPLGSWGWGWEGFIFVQRKTFKGLFLSFECGVEHVEHLMGIVMCACVCVCARVWVFFFCKEELLSAKSGTDPEETARHLQVQRAPCCCSGENQREGGCGRPPAPRLA